MLDDWGLGATDVMMVGDTLDTDVLGASQVGMRSVLVELEPNQITALGTIRPTYRVRRLLDIPVLLGP